ncbi:hypothetical protein ACQ4PT_047309 [Festuca glaucescens]
MDSRSQLYGKLMPGDESRPWPCTSTSSRRSLKRRAACLRGPSSQPVPEHVHAAPLRPWYTARTCSPAAPRPTSATARSEAGHRRAVASFESVPSSPQGSSAPCTSLRSTDACCAVTSTPAFSTLRSRIPPCAPPSGVCSAPTRRGADAIEDACARPSWQGVIRRVWAVWPNTKYIDVIATGAMAQYIATVEYYDVGLPLACTIYAPHRSAASAST